jgi:transcriptional regulator with AAA-type ATPase domain
VQRHFFYWEFRNLERDFDASNKTNRILDVLEEKRPKIICIDELDKMPKQLQEKLLNLMERGHIKAGQMRKHYDFNFIC